MREADEPHQLHVPNAMKIWEPKPPGTLWATPPLLRDDVTSDIQIAKFPNTCWNHPELNSNRNSLRILKKITQMDLRNLNIKTRYNNPDHNSTAPPPLQIQKR